MAMVADKSDGGKVWGLFKIPFRNSQPPAPTTTTASNFAHYQQNYGHVANNAHSQADGSAAHGGAAATSSVSSVARSLIPARRRLKLDPSKKLYFPCELLLDFALMKFDLLFFDSSGEDTFSMLIEFDLRAIMSTFSIFVMCLVF